MGISDDHLELNQGCKGDDPIFPTVGFEVHDGCSCLLFLYHVDFLESAPSSQKKWILCLKYDQILIRKVTCYLNKITSKIKAETTKLPTVGTHRGNELLRRKVNLSVFIMRLDLIIYWCVVRFVNMAYACSCNTLKIASNS